VQFFGDDFLRTLILRFVFCDVVLRLHRGFRGRHMRPRCEPQLPANELLEHPSLSHIIFQLASALDVRGHFTKELPLGGALLLYMSADGCFSTTKHPEDCEYKLVSFDLFDTYF